MAAVLKAQISAQQSGWEAGKLVGRLEKTKAWMKAAAGTIRESPAVLIGPLLLLVVFLALTVSGVMQVWTNIRSLDGSGMTGGDAVSNASQVWKNQEVLVNAEVEHQAAIAARCVFLHVPTHTTDARANPCMHASRLCMCLPMHA
eukprot:365970-Chlamydomonas_euryale.AAC.6